MYSSRGSNPYGQQQPYSSQSSYADQDLGTSAILGGRSQESEFGGLRAHSHVQGPASGAAAALLQPHYGGQYNSVYGSTTHQISPMGKGSVGTDNRSNYGSSIRDSPKFSTDYASSLSRGYGQKVDQLYSNRISEYPPIERHQYAERHGAYMGTDLPSETICRYSDPVSFGNEHQSKMYDRVEQSTMLRQEQALNTRAQQSTSVEGGARQADYLAARATVRHPGLDPISYCGRVDPESRGLSMMSSYGGKQTASILGAAPRRAVADSVDAQSSLNPGYGVSLPPGRDYGAGKGLHRSLLESDYPSSTLGRASHLRVDDRGTYGRELELWEKNRDFVREREKDRERDKERLREREREREREKERERDRERERKRERERECERERERERERRDKEKDRTHKRGLELRHESTPPRVSRDRRGPSLTKDTRSQRRESPHRDVLNRPHTPVKEERREYSCKVSSFSIVEAERDYLSLDKRYPRLYISPECSKVLAYWPKQNLHLPFRTPVSFEHDFVEEMGSAGKKEPPDPQLITDSSKEGTQTTIWNAKIILMSGLSQNAEVELSSEKIYGDRIPHFCNMLRFAFLKKNNSLMAIGGPCDSVDGEDPSVDDTSLIRTALRYAKDVSNLDLKNCQRWNRFLEIHYERVGKDSLSSHREVTVLFVPDVSECLPSLESWRDQWIRHKKAVAERDRQQKLKKEKCGQKEVSKGKKKAQIVKAVTTKNELQKKEEQSSSGHPQDDTKKDEDAQKPKDEEMLVSEEVKEKDKLCENKAVVGSTEDEKNVKTDTGEGSSDQKAVGLKSGKKKIIKRIVKKKVATKKVRTQDPAKQNDVPDKEDAGDKSTTSEVDVQKDGLSSDPAAIKTLTRKKVVRKPAGSVLKKDEDTTHVVKTANESEVAEDKANVKLEAASNKVIQKTGTKTKVKRKVIKRVPKRKAMSSDANSKVAEDDAKEAIQPEQVMGEHDKLDENQKNDIITEDDNSPEIKPKIVPSEEQHLQVENKGDVGDLSGSTVEANSVDQNVSLSDKATRSNENQELKDGEEGMDNCENQKNEIITEDNHSPGTNPQIIPSEKQHQLVKNKVDSEDLSGSTVEATSVDQKVSLVDKATSSNGKQELKDAKERMDNCENQKNEIVTKDNNSPEIKPQIVPSEKQHQEVENKRNSKDLSESTVKATNVHQKGGSQSDKATKSNRKQELKDEKEKTDSSGKNASNRKANDMVKEKRKIDEPPRHPGLIIQTKGSKESKLQSTSLSLDSLLSYSSEDLEESTFELSVFAESFYEMLQYEMGCRLLTFLQKLRAKFILKRNQGKRERLETPKKENKESPSRKRTKTIEDVEDIKPTKTENSDGVLPDENNIVKEEANVTKKVDDAKMETEEDPEEDVEMQDTSHHHDPPEEKLPQAEKMETDPVSDVARSEQNKKQETAEQTPETPSSQDQSNKNMVAKVALETKGTDGAIDKELLQAFRFFDRNRVGCIRVEDMRIIIHNLGKFHTNRDVKELVQSALLESNTGRDGRIWYEKLVRMSDL